MTTGYTFVYFYTRGSFYCLLRNLNDLRGHGGRMATKAKAPAKKTAAKKTTTKKTTTAKKTSSKGAPKKKK